MASNISTGAAVDSSLDPLAGGTYRGKPIWDVDQIDANLNRTGNDWYTDNYGELNDGVLNFGFWKNYEELANSYYVNATGSIALNEAYYADAFSPFTEGQMTLARSSISLWDDLVSISFRETKSFNADITYGNTDTGGAQAYAYLPFGTGLDDIYSAYYDFDEVGRIGGDVWIDGFVASNFFPLDDSYYAKTTMIHETGHAIGLSHPGDYNALDDNDGDGVPDPITYENDAFYAQDSRQYTVMSYFDAYETGAQHIDFSLLNFAYAATPLIHDISTIQEIYGADTTTRTGDTVYGFHSTADQAAFDFSVNTRPIVAIWDAGGNDTLDFSGWATPSLINLNEGSFSSGGGIEDFLTLDEINANRAAAGFAARTQEAYDFYEDLKAQYGITSGLFKDNISIAYGAVIENAVGGSGDDTIIVNSAANSIIGGGGFDTVSYETAESAVSISLTGQAGTGGALGDTLRQVENLTGSGFDDFLKGNNFANILDGAAGNDLLRGNGGVDTFVFHTNQTTGFDRIADFSVDDLIAVDKSLSDPDGDGFIAIGRNGVVLLDSTDNDVVKLQGTGTASGTLQLVGESNGLFYYAAGNSTVTTAQLASVQTHLLPNRDGGPVRPDHGQGTVYDENPLTQSFQQEGDFASAAPPSTGNSNPYGFQQAASPLDGPLAQAGGHGAVSAAAFGGDSAIVSQAFGGGHGGAIDASLIAHVILA